MHLESGRFLYGGARQVAYLIEELDRLGLENVLVCRPDAELAHSVPAVRAITMPLHGDLDFGSAFRIERVIRTQRPDIVHVHSRRGVDLFGGLAAWRAGVPAVLTRRVDSHEPAAWARLKYRHYDAVVAISSRIESQLRNEIGIEPGRVARIASAVDTDVYRPDADARDRLEQRLGPSSEHFLIGMVAQLIPRKGHLCLLESLADVVGDHPEVRVLLFGRGRLEAKIRRRIDSLGLTGHVSLAGFRRDLPELLPGFDLLVHPAAREGLGVAVLEAMACGVPVVASSAGGLVDLVTDDVEGMLVAPREPRALARAIDAMIANREGRKRMGSMGRQRVCERFSKAAMAERHRRLYGSILGNDHGSI